jgi:acyl-CoA thioesterase-2
VLTQLLDVLSPKQIEEDVFEGSNMHPDGYRIYGGQVLAQAVAAAAATVDAARELHSQHAYFLRPGDTTEPVRLEVDRARDGGSFSSRRVTVLQKGKPILVSSLSFQLPSWGKDFQPELPQVPAPEELVSERQLAIEAGGLNESFMITTGEDLDVRIVEPVDWQNPVPREPYLQGWVKTTGAIGDDPRLHQAMLAYISDMMLLDACMLPHGQDFMDPTLQIASLDHAIWFHRSFRADEWLLHTVEAEQVGGGRGLARGRFYSADGALVATVMQQGLLRNR